MQFSNSRIFAHYFAVAALYISFNQWFLATQRFRFCTIRNWKFPPNVVTMHRMTTIQTTPVLNRLRSTGNCPWTSYLQLCGGYTLSTIFKVTRCWAETKSSNKHFAVGRNSSGLQWVTSKAPSINRTADNTVWRQQLTSYSLICYTNWM